MKELTLERAQLLLAALEAEVAFGCGLTLKEEAYLQALRSHVRMLTFKVPVLHSHMTANEINAAWIIAATNAMGHPLK